MGEEFFDRFFFLQGELTTREYKQWIDVLLCENHLIDPVGKMLLRTLDAPLRTWVQGVLLLMLSSSDSLYERLAIDEKSRSFVKEFDQQVKKRFISGLTAKDTIATKYDDLYVKNFYELVERAREIYLLSSSSSPSSFS